MTATRWLAAALALGAAGPVGLAEQTLPGPGFGAEPNGAGAPHPWQASLPLGPHVTVNLATGNVHFRFPTSRFGEANLPPVHDLVFFFNSLAAGKAGDYDGGFDLGGGWSTSIAGRLTFPSGTEAVLTEPDGTEVLFEKQGGAWVPKNGSFLALENSGGPWVVRARDQSERHYDGNGRLVAIVSPEDNAYTITYQSGHADRADEPTGRFATFQYAGGQLDSIGGSFGLTWDVGYDAAGRLDEIIDPYGTISIQYDAGDRIASFTDLGGHTWAFTYFTSPLHEGRVKTITDPNGDGMSFAYIGGSQTQRTELTDLRGNLWKAIHDREPSPALVRFKNPFGHTWRYTHDDDRLLTRLRSPLGHDWEWTYDAQGRVLSSTDPLDRGFSSTYDALGNRLTSTWGGHTTHFHYEDPDLPTRVTRIVEPADEAGATATTLVDYYGPDDGTMPGEWNGRLETITDAMGGETHFTWDARGAIASMTEGPLTATGAVSLTWGGLVSPSYWDLGGMTYPASFPALPAAPAALQGRLDVLGDRTITWWGAPLVDTLDVQVPIDSGSGFESSTITRSRGYDHLLRLTSLDVQTDEPLAHVVSPPATAPTRSFSATYDDAAADGLVEMMTPDGHVVRAVRDAAGRITGVDTDGGGAGELDVDATWDADGRLDTVTLGSGASSVYDWYANGRLESLEHRAGAAVVLRLDYVWDDRNLLESITERSAGPTIEKDFTYDARGRLLTESRTDLSTGVTQELRYVYDAVGNRTRHEARVGGALVAAVDYHYDSADPATFGSHNHRLVRIERSDGAGQPTSTSWCFYDNAFGNLSRIVTRDAGSSHYTSTALVYAQRTATAWLVWDESWDDFGAGPVNVARGDAIEIRQLDVRPYLWRRRDGQTLAPVIGEEWSDAFGPLHASYLVDPFDGSPVFVDLLTVGYGRRSIAGPIEHASDHLRSVLMTAGPGSVTTAEYTAFGTRVSSAEETYGFGGVLGHRQSFQGGPITAARLVQAGWRLYSPELGRFVMRDPLGVFGGINVYAFATNRPTSLVDPTGLTPASPHGGQYRGPGNTTPPPGGEGPVWPTTVQGKKLPPTDLPPDPFEEPEFIGPPAPPPTPPEPYDGPQPGDPDFIGPLLPGFGPALPEA